VAESKIQKLQKDLTFYINKANTLENARFRQTTSPPAKAYGRDSHEDTKLSRSKSNVQRSGTSPFKA